MAQTQSRQQPLVALDLRRVLGRRFPAFRRLCEESGETPEMLLPLAIRHGFRGLERQVARMLRCRSKEVPTAESA